jgi:hypothetical protein
MTGMATEDWSTRAGLREIARIRGERIAGWRAPVAFAVGYESDGDWVFPHINRPGGTHGLPAVMLAEVLGYSSGTAEFTMTAAQLAEVIQMLEPAEAATDVEHPNLGAWRTIRAAEPATIAAVFVGDLGDPFAGPVDTALREQF